MVSFNAAFFAKRSCSRVATYDNVAALYTLELLRPIRRHEVDYNISSEINCSKSSVVYLHKKNLYVYLGNACKAKCIVEVIKLTFSYHFCSNVEKLKSKGSCAFKLWFCVIVVINPVQWLKWYLVHYWKVALYRRIENI